jgi:signal transduction histidine kinase
MLERTKTVGVVAMSLADIHGGVQQNTDFVVKQETRWGLLTMHFDQPVTPKIPVLVAMLVEQRVEHAIFLFSMANAVHNAKSSLTVASGYIELLQWKNPEDEYLHRAASQILLLDERLEEILGGVVDYPRTALDPSPLIQQLADEWGPYLQKKGIVLQTVLVSSWVMAERRRLIQVMQHLLHNASESILSPGVIRIEMQKNDDWLEIRVKDTGGGVDPLVATRLFSALLTTKDQGHGLGLLFSRQIIESWGGSLDLEPSATGAVFLIRLPMVEQGAPLGLDSQEGSDA